MSSGHRLHRCHLFDQRPGLKDVSAIEKVGLVACVTQIQALLRWSGRTFLGFRLWCMKAKQPRSARNADS